MAVSATIPASANTDLVSMAILVEGNEIPAEIQVIGIMIHKEVNKIPLAKIRISDGNPSAEDFEISNQDYFIPGKAIEIQLGYRSANTKVFSGIVVSHINRISPGMSELIIECRDKAVKMTVGRNSKHYNDMTDADIAEEIIGNYGLDKDVAATDITYKDMVQYDLTDWDFILSRMDMIGHICIVNDGKLSLQKPDLNSEPVLDLQFGSTILEYSAEIDARCQVKLLKSAAWDYSSQQVKEVDAAEPSISEEPGNISADELANTIGLDHYEMIHTGKIPEQALQAWADAKLQKQRLAKVRGRVKFQGFPDLLPGNFITLNGVGERFNGSVFVNAVEHECKDGNWTTEVNFGMSPEWFSETISPGHPSATGGMMPAMQGLSIGIVTDLEDPDGENRVRVKLPIVNAGEQGIWARIASLDAGNERGTFFLPEVDDEVIVGFINNDPTQIVILGMLYSSAHPAPFKASADNTEKGYVSREKLKMVFNDEEKSVKIETPAGKKITISENDGVIQMEDENNNKVTMDSNGITINAGTTLNLTAGTEIKIEAPSISLNGQTTTEIKGGIVKIN